MMNKCTHSTRDKMVELANVDIPTQHCQIKNNIKTMEQSGL